MIMDRLTDGPKKGAPWTMMFTDDIVLCSEDRDDEEVNLEKRRCAIEGRGMKSAEPRQSICA